MRLACKVSASVDVISGARQGSVLEKLFILCIFELLHLVGNHIVRYAIDTTIYAVFPRPLSPPLVMELLNQDLATIDS